ncbi:MAG: HNH endonuclease signature motif containing protein [Terriglobales bacterium]
MPVPHRDDSATVWYRIGDAMPGKSKPGKIHLRIVEVMKRFPGGISGGQIRQELEKGGLEPGDQTHLDRRKRDLKKWFVIKKDVTNIVISGKNRKVTLYKYAGVRRKVVDEGQVSLKERAEVIHGAHGRCQMCGKSVEQHGIVLVVDHKKPRDWGGTNDRDNLWAICEECNAGKKAYFSSLHADAELMKGVMAHKSVHVRIGELLKTVGVDKPTSSQLIDVVADQDDWQKRLRELRYPVIGWEIDTKLYRAPSGKKQCDYILKSFKPWPEDPSGIIRRFENERKKRNLAEDF